MTEIDTEEPELSRAEAATQWVHTHLANQGGSAPAKDIYREGERHGYPRQTLQYVLRTSRDLVAVKKGRAAVWGLVTEEERQAVATAHSTDLDALEERQRDRTRPFRTVVTNWPCRGVSRVVTDTLDESAPGGYVRRTSWVHSQPTTCKAPTPTGETR